MTLGLTLSVAIALAPVAKDSPTAPDAEANESDEATDAEATEPDEATDDEDEPDDEDETDDEADDDEATEPDDEATDEVPEPTYNVVPEAPYGSDSGDGEVAPGLDGSKAAPRAKKGDDDDDEPETQRGIGFMAAGAPLVAAGGVLLPIGLWVRAVGKTHSLHLEANDGDPQEIYEADIKTRNGIIMAVVGGTVAAAGIPLLVTGIVRYVKYKNQPRRRASLTPTMGMGRGGASVGVHVRF